jgi:hypothetical protein
LVAHKLVRDHGLFRNQIDWNAQSVFHLVFDSQHLKQTDMTTKTRVEIDITARLCLTTGMGSEKSQMSNITTLGSAIPARQIVT